MKKSILLLAFLIFASSVDAAEKQSAGKDSPQKNSKMIILPVQETPPPPPETYTPEYKVPAQPSVKVSKKEEEPWKGSTPEHNFTTGLLSGLGVFQDSAAFALTLNVARKIVDHGFVPDINNQVFVEMDLGPYFLKGSTAWFYSTHIRWDFVKDEVLTLYGLGGVAGHLTGESFQKTWTFLPRLGIGIFAKFHPFFSLRAEYSHELIGLGISYCF